MTAVIYSIHYVIINQLINDTYTCKISRAIKEDINPHQTAEKVISQIDLAQQNLQSDFRKTSNEKLHTNRKMMKLAKKAAYIKLIL